MRDSSGQSSIDWATLLVWAVVVGAVSALGETAWACDPSSFYEVDISYWETATHWWSGAGLLAGVGVVGDVIRESGRTWIERVSAVVVAFLVGSWLAWVDFLTRPTAGWQGPERQDLASAIGGWWVGVGVLVLAAHLYDRRREGGPLGWKIWCLVVLAAGVLSMAIGFVDVQLQDLSIVHRSPVQQTITF